VLRLIEYLIAPDANADDVLRNSLVGRMNFAWGQLTATIVDSADLRQEDLLGMARRQPGVWLANPNATVLQSALAMGKVNTSLLSRQDEARITADLAEVRQTRMGSPLPPAPIPSTEITPTTGYPYAAGDALLARQIVEIGGYLLAHTLSLALSSIAPELEENSDSGKFMDRDAALRLAQALMDEIPDAWINPPAPPLAVVPIDPTKQAAIDRVRDGARPTTTPWVDPTQPGVMKL
jgi:hypothetical protein